MSDKGRRTTEYVQVGNEQHAREVVEVGGMVAVNGQPFGTLTRDPLRPQRREWVLTGPGAKVTESPSKRDALVAAGRLA